ncbi:unnamed protein product [Rotaria sp. Silwood2]|nr:unnamed protein product [Rotaria sp. Silwood2]CAF4315847.1 unnamed protein product [Rotaria sp. Silwood2]
MPVSAVVGESASSDDIEQGDEDENDNEIMVMDPRKYYRMYLLRAAAFLHSSIAFLMMISYYKLKAGIRADGGSTDELELRNGDSLELYRIVFDITLIFFIIVILLPIIRDNIESRNFFFLFHMFNNNVLGLIIDAFDDLREQLDSVEETLENDMNLEYTVTETVYRDHSGQMLKIDFQFNESATIVLGSTSSITSRQNQEKRYRSYHWSITRDQYESRINRLQKPITFDAFIDSLRPIIMGYYKDNELERAFAILDSDQSGTINIKEFSTILLILNDSIDANVLSEYIKQVDENFDGELNYEEFQALVLRGIGRDIICNHF